MRNRNFGMIVNFTLLKNGLCKVRFSSAIRRQIEHRLFAIDFSICKRYVIFKYNPRGYSAREEMYGLRFNSAYLTKEMVNNGGSFNATVDGDEIIADLFSRC